MIFDGVEVESKKANIRKAILQARKALDETQRRKASILLADRILGHQWYYLSENLLGFVPYGSEIDVREILQDALKSGRKLYLPKVNGEEMDFFRVTSLDELQTGYRGILEPAGNRERFVYDRNIAEKTLMLMPGTAFDNNRNRIGYGKGYYDKYLRGKPDLQVRTIGVGFLCQMVEQIPNQEWDIKPYQVICV